MEPITTSNKKSNTNSIITFNTTSIVDRLFKVEDRSSLSKEFLDSEKFNRKSANSRGGWPKFLGLKGGAPPTLLDNCNDCREATQHRCKICGVIRCTQLHLESRDDGATFICCICDPTVRGFSSGLKLRAPKKPINIVTLTRGLKLLQASNPSAVAPAPSPAPRLPSEEDTGSGKARRWIKDAKVPGLYHAPAPFPAPRLPSEEDTGSEKACRWIKDAEVPSLYHAEDQLSESLEKKEHSIFVSSSIDPPSSSSLSKAEVGFRRNLFGDEDGRKRKRVEEAGEVAAHAVPPPDVQGQVEMHVGSVPGVLFLGPVGCRHWLHDQLTTTYWIAPSLNLAVMLRSNTECLLAEATRLVTEYMQRKSDIKMTLPILTFKGNQKLENQCLSQFTTGDTFLIHDQTIPELDNDHSGFLWECGVCGMSGSKLANVNRVNCHKRRIHNTRFDDILIIKSWGSHMDRKLKPYGCPLGHTGTGSQSIKQVQPQQVPQPFLQQPQLPQIPPQPRTPSQPPSSPAGGGSPSTPTTPRPSGSRRFETQLEQYLSPRPGTSRAGLPVLNPPSGAGEPNLPGGSQAWGPDPTTKIQLSKRLRSRTDKPKPQYTFGDQESDLTDSDGGDDANYVPDSGGQGEEHDKSDDSSDESEESDEEPDKLPVSRLPAMSDTEDEYEDSDDVREGRRRNRAIFREKLLTKNRKQEGDWSTPDVWDCRCEKCRELMAQLIVRPRIEMSTRWNSAKNDAPKEVKEMVEMGILPSEGKVFKKMWKDIASTPIMYSKGLQYFLAQFQKSLQESRATRHKLDNGRLHLWQMLAFEEWNQIIFSENPMPLISKIVSPNMQKFAWCGYKQLLESTILWLAKLDGGVDKFFIETVREDGEDTKVYQNRARENDRKARQNRYFKFY